MAEKEKKEFWETGFGNFLKKAGGVVGDVSGIAVKAVSGDIKGAISDIGNKLGDKQDDPVAQQLKIELERNRQSFQVEMEALDVEKIKSHHSLEAIQLQQEDLWTKRARPTRQYFWLLAVIGMIILDHMNAVQDVGYRLLDFNNPLLYIMAADFGYYTLMRTKEKLNGKAE